MTTRGRRSRSTSGSGIRRGRRRSTFWVTNSIPGQTVLKGAVATVDMLAGATPTAREALRRMTILRMLINVAVRPLTTGTLVEYAFWVYEAIREAIAAGVIPVAGIDEAGMYLAEDGIEWAPDAFEQNVSKFDIRTARALRGSDRSLGFAIFNQNATSDLVVSVSFRLLVAYG